jgi:hypothetical protein
MALVGTSDFEEVRNTGAMWKLRQHEDRVCLEVLVGVAGVVIVERIVRRVDAC